MYAISCELNQTEWNVVSFTMINYKNTMTKHNAVETKKIGKEKQNKNLCIE